MLTKCIIEEEFSAEILSLMLRVEKMSFLKVSENVDDNKDIKSWEKFGSSWIIFVKLKAEKLIWCKIYKLTF